MSAPSFTPIQNNRRNYSYIYIYCAVLKHMATPSDYHIPLPSIVPFAHSETSFTHDCIHSNFPGSSRTTSFFPSFRFPVDHNFWQSHRVHSLNMSIPNELFLGYVIQYRILRVHFYSMIYSFVFLCNLEILANRLNASISVVLTL
jgi:hypothetical protein